MPEEISVAAKHALELRWHEEHPEEGEEERISAYKQLILRRMRAQQWLMLGDLAGKRVLEVGCGVGRETVELAKRGARVVAVDLSPTLVARARGRAAERGVADRVEFRVGAAEELSTDGEQFDVVVGNGVLHHLDLATFKTSLVRLMRPEGVAQFQEPLVHNPLLRLYRRLTPHLHSPTERPLARDDVLSFVQGFRDVYIEYFNLVGLLLLPAPYIFGSGVSDALLRRALRCDRAMFAVVPALRRFCQYAILQVCGSPYRS